MEQKKAWIYCRVAHNGPDSAEILERQRHRLESYAKEHGFEIVGVSSDIGCGLTMDRPGLLDFHAAAEDGIPIYFLSIVSPAWGGIRTR